MEERPSNLPNPLQTPTRSEQLSRFLAIVAGALLSTAVVGAMNAPTAKSSARGREIMPAAEPTIAANILASTEVELADPELPEDLSAAVQAIHRVTAAEAPAEVAQAAEIIELAPLEPEPALTGEIDVTPDLQVMMMEVTAYCACTHCCGPAAQGITASGKPVSYNNGLFVAADTRLLPFGTEIQIPGYANGEPVEVIDRGGAIKGNRLDVYFPSHQQAREWGRRWIAVTVLP